MFAQTLDVSQSGVGTVFRPERDEWPMVKLLRQATNEYAPPTRINSMDAVIYMQESLHQKRFLVGCSSPFTQLDQHLTELRAWCKQCLPGR